MRNGRRASHLAGFAAARSLRGIAVGADERIDAAPADGAEDALEKLVLCCGSSSGALRDHLGEEREDVLALTALVVGIDANAREFLLLGRETTEDRLNGGARALRRLGA